ncbi:MAG: hypothetical protein Q7J35_16080 [Candidatus Methanoperedens sp.]|nr:hypothetical protein [Candidatus Methanoperedens sp.]
MRPDSAASSPGLTSSCPFCDELEAGFMRSQADSEKLMEAVCGEDAGGVLISERSINLKNTMME